MINSGGAQEAMARLLTSLLVVFTALLESCVGNSLREKRQGWNGALARSYLGPNSLIFSFSSGASPAHNAGGRVLPLCI